MPARILIRLQLAVAFLLGMTACESTAPQDSRAELQRQLAETREVVSRYEKRYGKLRPAQSLHDFRTLRARLKGKNGSAVVAVLGKPAKVYYSGTTESWEYANVAYDPVSRRPVRNLEIWFRNGVVDYMNTSF